MSNRRGFILLLVVVVLIGAAAVLSVTSLSVRLQAMDISTSADLAQIRAAGNAVLARAVLGLDDDPPLYPDGRQYSFAINGVQANYRIIDTSGLVDLNGAEVPLLAALFERLGQSAPDAEALAAAIIDWRDPDDEPQERGAEKRAYRSAGLPEPGNRPFLDVSEARGVLGMNAVLYAAAAPYLTAGKGRKTPAAQFAPPLVLDILDVDPAKRRDILERRRAGEPLTDENAAIARPARAATKLKSNPAGRYILLVEAHRPGGAQSAMRINFSTGPRPGDYAILSWRTEPYGRADALYDAGSQDVAF